MTKKSSFFPSAQWPKLSIALFFLIITFLTVVVLYNEQTTQQFAAGSYFQTLPPGTPLPSDATCAAEVRRNPWEPRPENTTANQTNVYAQGYRMPASDVDGYGARVTGNFTGTTDEIIQWAACKWGFDEDTVRAQAVVESYWEQSAEGDCIGNSQPQTNGCQSVGLLQVRGADIPPTHPDTWPYALNSTAFNVDYAMAVRRDCYEGKMTWLNTVDHVGTYAAGDLWGCIGVWYSGRWHTTDSETYIQKVQTEYNNKQWIAWGYPGIGGGTVQPTATNTPTPILDPTGPLPTTTPTPTTKPTNTPIPTAKPTATSTPIPSTLTPTPTATGALTISLPHVLLDGLGMAGDSVNPGSQGNMSPKHLAHFITIQLLDNTNQQVAQVTGAIAYSSTTGEFSATSIPLGISSPGTYLIRITIPQYLTVQVPGFFQMAPGQITIMPTLRFVTGDANGDNKLDILDYNTLLGCYSDLLPPTNCTATNKAATDFSDDGNVNQTDYNLFLRELSVRTGQ